VSTNRSFQDFRKFHAFVEGFLDWVKISGISTVVEVTVGTALTFHLELYVRISNHVCRRFSGFSKSDGISKTEVNTGTALTFHQELYTRISNHEGSNQEGFQD
jgi:hypothetical protein